MHYSWITSPTLSLLRPPSTPRPTSPSIYPSVRLSPIPIYSHRPHSTYTRRPRSPVSLGTPPDGPFHIPVLTVPTEQHMLTPGELRQVTLHYSLFHTILQTGSTLFGCVSINDWSFSPALSARGCLLSILTIKGVIQERNVAAESDTDDVTSPKVTVECKCSGRFDVSRLISTDFAPSVGARPPLWKLVQAEGNVVRDRSCREFEDRLKLAKAEWDVWQSCTQVTSLLKELGTASGATLIAQQELAVWAPKNYDRDVSEGEWRDTPMVTRAVWCQRAEALSFGILRYVSSDDRVMRAARGLTDTVTRLELAMECVEKKKAMTRAQISLKNALN